MQDKEEAMFASVDPDEADIFQEHLDAESQSILKTVIDISENHRRLSSQTKAGMSLG
jgi:hypothetical protein